MTICMEELTSEDGARRGWAVEIVEIDSRSKSSQPMHACMAVAG